MRKYQVVKIEKNHVGVFEFEDERTATKMFMILATEGEREEELDITQHVYLTNNGKIIVSWDKK